MKGLGWAFFALVVLVFASLWGLGYLAFGNAKCSGVNPFAVTALSVITVIFIYTTFAGTDWINDWFAARAVTKAQIQTNRSLTEQARTVTAQLAAHRKLAPSQDQMGGLEFSDGVFEEYGN